MRAEVTPVRGQRTREVARNTVVSAATHVASTFAVLAATPFLVVKLGIAGYGVWVLISSVVRYGFLADFGLGPTIVKYAAEYVARGDRRSIAEIMTFGALFPIIVGAAIVPAASLVIPSLIGRFHMPADLEAQAPSILTSMLAYLFLLMSANVLLALLRALGRMDLAAVSAAIGQITFAGGAVVLAAEGFGLRGLLIATYAQLAITAALNFIMLLRLYGRMFCSPTRIQFHSISKLFRMSGWIQLSLLFGFAGTETDLVVLGLFAGVSVVAIFDIGSKLARSLLALAYHFNSALLPAVSALEVDRGGGATAEATVQGTRYLGAVSLLTTGFMVAAAPLVLRAWLGSAVPNIWSVALVLGVLSVTFILYNIVGVGTTVLRALGKPRLEASYLSVYASLKLLLSLLLTPHYALLGLLTASSASTVIGTAYFFNSYRRLVSVALSNSIRDWAPPTILVVIVTAAPLALAVHYLPIDVLDSRWKCGLGTLVAGACYVSAFVAMLKVVRFFRPEDQVLIAKIFPDSWLRLAGVAA